MNEHLSPIGRRIKNYGVVWQVKGKSYAGRSGEPKRPNDFVMFQRETYCRMTLHPIQIEILLSFWLWNPMNLSVA